MKKSLSLFILISFVLTFPVLAEGKELEARQKVAVKYFEKLTIGDIETANELVTTPYTLDLKKVLNTKEEVFEFHKKMLSKKGKRDIPKYTCKVTDDAIKLDPKVFPPYTPFRIEIKGNGKLYIYVSNKEVPKILGFAD